MYRKFTATFVVSLLAVLLLGGCTMGLAVVLPIAFGSMPVDNPASAEIGYPNLVDRQAVADYQATLPLVVHKDQTTAPSATKFLQINDRQELADYQATLPLVVHEDQATAPSATMFLQINDRQELADYQATLPIFVAPSDAYQGD